MAMKGGPVLRADWVIRKPSPRRIPGPTSTLPFRATIDEAGRIRFQISQDRF